MYGPCISGRFFGSVLIALITAAGFFASPVGAQECVDYGTMPHVVGQGELFGARDLAVAGNYACVTYYGGLLVADVTPPSSPVLLGSVDTVEEFTSVNRLAVAEPYA